MSTFVFRRAIFLTDDVVPNARRIAFELPPAMRPADGPLHIYSLVGENAHAWSQQDRRPAVAVGQRDWWWRRWRVIAGWRVLWLDHLCARIGGWSRSKHVDQSRDCEKTSVFQHGICLSLFRRIQPGVYAEVAEELRPPRGKRKRRLHFNHSTIEPVRWTPWSTPVVTSDISLRIYRVLRSVSSEDMLEIAQARCLNRTSVLGRCLASSAIATSRTNEDCNLWNRSNV